jgi:hypothetical protein
MEHGEEDERRENGSGKEAIGQARGREGTHCEACGGPSHHEDLGYPLENGSAGDTHRPWYESANARRDNDGFDDRWTPMNPVGRHGRGLDVDHRSSRGMRGDPPSSDRFGVDPQRDRTESTVDASDLGGRAGCDGGKPTGGNSSYRASRG